MRRRLTLDQVNEIIGENSLPGTNGWFPVRKITPRTGPNSLVSFVFKTISFGSEHTD